MLQKSEVINLINSIINEQNKWKLEEYIDKLNSMDDDTWKKFIEEHSLDTLDKLKIELERRLRVAEANNEPFTRLNELISYGITGDTLHIHVVPKDARNLLTEQGLVKAESSLIDALEQIKEIIKEDSNINNVYAVSGIIKSVVAEMFSKLGFDVKVLPMGQAKDDEELSWFYERFKGTSLKLGRAKISKEKLLSPEWEVRKQGRKEIFEKEANSKGQDR